MKQMIEDDGAKVIFNIVYLVYSADSCMGSITYTVTFSFIYLFFHFLPMAAVLFHTHTPLPYPRKIKFKAQQQNLRSFKTCKLKVYI